MREPAGVSEKHNCDRIQGYLISRPLNEDDAIKFLENIAEAFSDADDNRPKVCLHITG